MATGDFVAVMDGSTSKSPFRIDPHISNGRLCMLAVSGYIRHMPGDMTAHSFCENITSIIKGIYLSHDIDMRRLEVNPTERMAASAAIYSKQHREVWLVGDCQCIVGGVMHDNPKPYEAHVAAVRSEYIHKALAQGCPMERFQIDDKGRTAALPVLIASCKNQNKTFAVIDGFDIPMEHVKVINADGADSDIILATDGYPFLKPTLRESEEALARQLASDPLCIDTFKATKGLMLGNRSFDDRCYVRFRP